MIRQRAVTMFALLALAAAPVSAQEGPPPPGTPPPPGPMHLAFALKGLELTPEQSARIEPLLKARHDEGEAGRSAVEAARHLLGDQIRADVFDDGAIRAKAAAVAALEADRAVADAALLRDVRAVLTPGQRDDFDQRLQPPPPPATRGEMQRAWSH